jgi:lauroyl/myristoyl acyltransferase
MIGSKVAYLRTSLQRVAITKADVYLTSVLLVMALVSWLWPLDRLLSAVRMWRRLRGGHGDPFVHVAPADVPPSYFASQHAALSDRRYEARMQILAMLRPGRRWKPDIRWHGLEHLEIALGQESGAILWDGNFVYQRLITKMAFHQAGYPLTWLSRPDHGFSSSSYAIRFLNPYSIAIEDRFLAERIVVVDDKTLDRLRKRLVANKVVGILVVNIGRRIIEVPFLTSGRIQIATGPVYLSHISGAPLIPVFTVRAEDGSYDVSVGPPLDVPRAVEVPPDFTLDYQGIVKSYVNMLETHVLRHPDQYSGWGSTKWERDNSFTPSVAIE